MLLFRQEMTQFWLICHEASCVPLKDFTHLGADLNRCPGLCLVPFQCCSGLPRWVVRSFSAAWLKSRCIIEERLMTGSSNSLHMTARSSKITVPLSPKRGLLYQWAIPFWHSLGVSSDGSKCGGVFLIFFGVTFGVLRLQAQGPYRWPLHICRSNCIAFITLLLCTL